MKQLILGTVAAACLAAPFASQAVVVAGVDWRKPSEVGTFSGFSYNQIASVCSVTTGACAGTLGSGAGAVSFDGWTWASNVEVQGLFDSLIHPGTTQFPTSTSDYSEANSADISSAVALFGITYVASFGNDTALIVRGWSRTAGPLNTGLFAYSPYLVDWSGTGLVPNDSGILSELRLANSTSIGGGAWLYKATAVPLPASAWLLLSGLLGLGMVARQRALTQQRY